MLHKNLSVSSVVRCLWLAALLFVTLPLSANEDDHTHHDHAHGASESHPDNLDANDLLAQPVYTCSMHPHIRSHDPDGRCPICGMALVPVAEEHRPEVGSGDVADGLRL